MLAVVLMPASARAFSDPLTFGDETTLGGGGGRFFTGSAADGYGCDVCHSGGTVTPLRILGLPLSGYAPGTAYEVQIVWPVALEHVALALELNDERGLGAGSLRLPPADELPEPERCEPVADGLGAGLLTTLEGGRVILSVADCGAKRVRFLWTAPNERRGTLRLSGGLVVSDAMADVIGDSTTMFTHALAPAGEGAALATNLSASAGVSCAVALGAGRGVDGRRAFGASPCALWLLAFATRRRRARRKR